MTRAGMAFLGGTPIESDDYEIAQAALVGNTTLPPPDPDRCDVTGDGLCNLLDLCVLDRIVNGASASVVDACPDWGAP